MRSILPPSTSGAQDPSRGLRRHRGVGPISPRRSVRMAVPSARRTEHHPYGPPHHHDREALEDHARADRRHRCRGRDAWCLPRVRRLGHPRPGPARRTGRSQARPPPDPLLDERDGPAPRPRAREVQPRRRRGHGQVPPARRHRDLRRARPDGPALRHAAAPRRRARQLRLARRRPGRLPVHRGPDGTGRPAHGGQPRRGHRPLRPELRRPAAPARGAAGRLPQPPRQRHDRYRRRHGHADAAAQPRRGHRGGPPPADAPPVLARRPHALRPRTRPARRGPDRRARRDPRRLPHRQGHLPHTGDDPGGEGLAAPPGDHRHRAALPRRPREGHREDQGRRPGEAARGHRRRQGPLGPDQRAPARHRDQERLQPRGRPREALPAHPDGGVLLDQQRGARRRDASHDGAQGAAPGLRRLPGRRRAPAHRAPSREATRPAAPRRRPAHRDPRHRRGHPGHPDQRRRGDGPAAAAGRLRSLGGPGDLHPRPPAAPADEVLQARARAGAGGAAPPDRRARGDPRR